MTNLPPRCSLARETALRAALEPFAKFDTHHPYDGMLPSVIVKVADVRRARQALASTTPEGQGGEGGGGTGGGARRAEKRREKLA